MYFSPNRLPSLELGQFFSSSVFLLGFPFWEALFDQKANSLILLYIINSDGFY